MGFPLDMDIMGMVTMAMDTTMERDLLIQHLHLADMDIMVGTMERDQLKLYQKLLMDMDTMERDLLRLSQKLGTMAMVTMAMDTIMERDPLKLYQKLLMDMDTMEKD